MSSQNNDTPSHISDPENDTDPIQILKKVKISNINRLVIGNLNINSLRNKFESLKLIVKGNINILVLAETQLDNTFPHNNLLECEKNYHYFVTALNFVLTKCDKITFIYWSPE